LPVPNEPIEYITACRSSSWTPPWWDQKFLDWLASAPVEAEYIHGPEIMGDIFSIAADPMCQLRGDWPQSWPEVKALFATESAALKAMMEVLKKTRVEG